MINGPAVGSGMDMALHCDIRIGCERTRFIGYHNAGQIIENGGSYYLPKMVGLGRALEFVYTGELKAERAYEWGMLNHLVASEELEAFTRELCGRSEEHTSELQSLMRISSAVFCLKKKRKQDRTQVH